MLVDANPKPNATAYFSKIINGMLHRMQKFSLIILKMLLRDEALLICEKIN